MQGTKYVETIMIYDMQLSQLTMSNTLEFKYASAFPDSIISSPSELSSASRIFSDATIAAESMFNHTEQSRDLLKDIFLEQSIAEDAVNAECACTYACKQVKKDDCIIAIKCPEATSKLIIKHKLGHYTGQNMMLKKGSHLKKFEKILQ